MDEAKRASRNIATSAKKTAHDLDGTSPSNRIGNAGDEVRKDLGNLGDEVRKAAGDSGQG
jgi:hypothetical protein